MPANGPSKNVRLDQLKRSPSVADSNPPEPVMLSDGKNADFATPIREFAAAIARSAAAISGRRSSNEDGKPGGMLISTGFSGLAAIENCDADLPSSTARLCSDAARKRCTVMASDFAVASSDLA